MSEAKPAETRNPGRFSELYLFGKLILGICLIAFGCWRAYVWAFGADESLLFASRVTARHAVEEAAALKQYASGVRDLKRGNRKPEEREQGLDKLDRELAQSMEEQSQRDRKGYRMQRWMELPVVLFAFTFGPGLLRVGKDGIRWPKRKRAELPDALPDVNNNSEGGSV